MAVVATYGQRVLFGKRALADEGFEWQLPGGWIESGETPQQAALREVFEETALRLRQPRFVGLSNNLFSSHKHSISLYFEAECVDAGILNAAENVQYGSWEWRGWTEITDKLYLPLRLLKQTDYRPFLRDQQKTHVSF